MVVDITTKINTSVKKYAYTHIISLIKCGVSLAFHYWSDKKR